MIKKYLLHLSYIGFGLGLSLLSCNEQTTKSKENNEVIEANATVDIINEVKINVFICRISHFQNSLWNGLK
jgi:hypothetical protein